MSVSIESAIHSHVLQEPGEHARRFAARDPFRHVVIDDFLTPAFAQRLLDEFPAFERGNARNEAGELGSKSTVERIRGLGSSYVELDDLIQTPAFHDLIGQITGIDDLLYDPHYFGGGTHENRAGQDLDPHIDFNRHPVENWHRRLNLIVYLNHEWQDGWGGSLELHRDPRASDNSIKLVTPLFNRCVIFETTESSWQGFSRIAPPAAHADASRRSIALYFYTRDRPREEPGDTHSTIYVDRPLPEAFKAGMVLSETDMQTLRVLLTRRDHHIQRLYRDLTRIWTELEQARAALSFGRIGCLRYLIARMRGKLAW